MLPSKEGGEVELTRTLSDLESMKDDPNIRRAHLTPVHELRFQALAKRSRL